MKKLFVFAIAAGLFFVACNSGASEATTDSVATEAVDTLSAEPVVDSVATPVDSAATAVDSAAAESAEHH